MARMPGRVLKDITGMSTTPLEAAAEAALNPASGDAGEGPRRRGRPPGSKNKPKDGTQARASAPASDSGGPFNFVYHREQESVDASTVMARTVWGLASVMLPVRPLNAEESAQLGEALDPVLCRWIPVFGQWKYEMALVMCIYALYETTRIKDAKPASDSVAEVVS